MIRTTTIIALVIVSVASTWAITRTRQPLDLAPSNFIATFSTDADFTIAVMSDIQGGPYDPVFQWGEWRSYRDSAWRLSEAIKWINNVEDLDCVVHCGDFVEANPVAWGALLPIWDTINAPAYHVVGNHDIYSVGQVEAVKRMGLSDARYAVDFKGWRLIFLNTTPNVRYLPGGEKTRAHTLNMGDDLDWLTKQLAGASRAIVFGHHPEVFPAIAPIMRDAGNASLYVCGHQHSGEYRKQDGIHMLNLRAMCNSLDTSAFAVLRIYTDRIEVDGFGREPDRVIK